jgi:FkbM family methyltransferase
MFQPVVSGTVWDRTEWLSAVDFQALDRARWLGGAKWMERARKSQDLLRNRGRGFRPVLFDDHALSLPRKLWRHWWHGEHPDAPLFRFLAGALPGAGIFLDVGANIGLYSAAWSMATARPHLALEPVPQTAALCREVLALNGIVANVWGIAAGRTHGTVTLTASGGGANNRWARDRSMVEAGTPLVDVVAAPLDDLVAWASVQAVAAIKIDVEGQELEVLEGAIETIRRWKPRLVVECHCASWEELNVDRRRFAQLIDGFGYRYVAGPDGRSADLGKARRTVHLLCS